MKKFEYKAIEGLSTRIERNTRLELEGKDGWELCFKDKIDYVFKREVEEGKEVMPMAPVSPSSNLT
jgi:hypothetical protein